MDFFNMLGSKVNIASGIRPVFLPAEPLRAKTFAEMYCERFGIPRECYEADVFRRCLHSPAAMAFPLLRFAGKAFFACDLDFVRGVGRIRRREDFESELGDYLMDPRCFNWLRWRCKLRISCRLLGRLVREIMPDHSQEYPSVRCS